MDGYTDSTYGDAFADVYDDWYGGISDVDATVDLLAELAGEFAPLPVLELGVGTGRLAVPLAAKGVEVIGLDASAAMLDKLAEHDTAGAVRARLGDMVDDQPVGPVRPRLRRLQHVLQPAQRKPPAGLLRRRRPTLAPGGAFVIEAFVPEPQPGTSVGVRSMTVDSVVLSVTTHDDEAQTAQGHYISISESGGVRMRPWAIRYATVDQLDAMAAACRDSVSASDGKTPDRAPFTADSPATSPSIAQFTAPSVTDRGATS